MSLNKEKRDWIRRDCDLSDRNCRPVKITPAEVRALLDMADERDRYRALLVEIYRDKWTDPDLMERIERGLGEENPLIGAVLEGKQ